MAIRIRNNLLSSPAIGTPTLGPDSSYTCNRCFAVFKSLDEFEKHLKQEKDVKPMDKGKKDNADEGKNIPPNPIWWTTTE